MQRLDWSGCMMVGVLCIVDRLVVYCRDLDRQFGQSRAYTVFHFSQFCI